MSATTHVLLIASDLVGERMAGPGIRFWEFARSLSPHLRVTLVIPPHLESDDPPPEPGCRATVLICDSVAELERLVADADVIVTLGALVPVYPFLVDAKAPLVLDAYDPFMLAGLQQFADLPMTERLVAHERYREAHMAGMRSADFVICASERQRDHWLGMLSAAGRINPFTHDRDATFRELIDVVPFGLPARPACHTRAVLKGVYPGIERGDQVILWGGGIWNWLDAPTALHAMTIVSERRPHVKLLFMGVDRPNRRLGRMSAVDQARELSRALGLTGRSVFFNSWVPYEDRQNYLLEADLGLSLHRDILESRFAFRTRLLDCLWTGLPVVVTAGDVLADEVERWQLGTVVPPGDPAAVAQAILALLDRGGLREAMRPRFEQVADRYRWDTVLQPLLRFCRVPHHAPDRAYRRTLSLDVGVGGPGPASVAARARRWARRLVSPPS